MNEPFIGSDVKQVNELLFGTFMQLYQERKAMEIEELFAAWDDPEQKHELLNFLDDMEAFQKVITATAAILQSFDEKVLTRFYEKVAQEIRKVDPKGILFLEANYFSNLGSESMIQPVKNKDGKRDPQQAYAPHTYDFVTDTELSHVPNDEQLRFIYKQHEQTRERLNMPMLIGEWGAFYESEQAAHVSLFVQRLIEATLSSDTYWDYTPNMDQSPSILGVRRGYPKAVSGELLNYRYEHAVHTFQMKWIEEEVLNKPTVIYLPNIHEIQVTLFPFGSIYHTKPIQGTEAGFIEIPPVGKQNRSLVIVGP